MGWDVNGDIHTPGGLNCHRNQIAQAKERIAELESKLNKLLTQRMSEAEAKLGTRPAEAVVGELEAENRRLREALEAAVRRLKPIRHALPDPPPGAMITGDLATGQLQEAIRILESALKEAKPDA